VPHARSLLAAAAACAAGALLAAGCGGGGDSGTTGSTGATTQAASPVAVRVVNGDTGAPISGATVRAIGSSGAVATTDGSGRAEAPAGTRLVRVRKPGFEPARAGAKGAGDVVVRLYDPELQSPQYGVEPARTRFNPNVKAGPPSGPPGWIFDGRTLLEFPPAVDEGVAVVGTNAGRVFALDVQTGKVRWARRQKGYIAATPAIFGGRVYVASMDGRLTCYRIEDGAKIWDFSTGGQPIESSPLIVGDALYFASYPDDSDGTLYSFDVRTGKQRWRFHADAAIKGSAALAGDAIVAADYAGNVYAVRRSNGALAWRVRAGKRFYGGPGVSGGTIVIGDVGGAIVALGASSGSERWRVSTGGAYVYSSPAIANGVAYVGSYDGRLRAIDLDSGAVRWSFDVQGRISGSASVVNGVVYTSRLYAPGQARATFGLDARTGAVRWRGGDGRYSPAVGAGRTLYLVGTRRLYAYRSGPPVP
jgi:outer membrane protein assembly factor BamB